ncbi:MAG TPA: preprotein translocase subunit SecG [Chloroflexi bacterium]|nr:preprotein translocase subunit SecG [Chloroflexota bacterium]HBV94583.1 preprotein translocase subunit SecG [Chloroflexota bacterium]
MPSPTKSSGKVGIHVNDLFGGVCRAPAPDLTGGVGPLDPEGRSGAGGILAADLTRRSVCVLQVVLIAAQVVLAILVILGILLQTPKATGLGGVIGGGGDSGGGYRRRRGLEAGLLRASAVFIALFVIVAAINVWINNTA